jgi:hypothetical protein
LEFYLGQREDPPEAYYYASGLIPSPSFFSVKTLQDYASNPLIGPPWISLVRHGKPVSLDNAVMFKLVQRNKLLFTDKGFINRELEKGAALLLEGVDILDPDISTFVARVEKALPCSLCNSVAFFSQRGNEAYDGHVDSDDVLVIHISGKKAWNIYEPQQRRYEGTTHLGKEQLGPRIKQVTMRPGDALYLRAGVPHVCETLADHSLHLAFDLVDTTPNVRQITERANDLYDYACEEPYAPPEQVVERYVRLLQSPDFQERLVSATQGLRRDAAEFRQCISRASSLDALSKFM